MDTTQLIGIVGGLGFWAMAIAGLGFAGIRVALKGL